MNLTQFQATITRLERTATAAPGPYHVKVGVLAALGYLYVLVLLGLVGGGFVFFGAAMISGRLTGALFKVELALGFLGYMILRALWVRVPAPEGLEVSARTAPRLLNTVDEVRHRLAAPRFHHVLLTDDLNASVVQVPRLGVLGWQRNYLTIGMPLLEALSPEQFRAVLAHEFGHLSGNHARFGAWIYRVRQTWARLLEQLEQHDSFLGQIFVTPFLKWYAPYFSAYSFVLARQQEYLADQHAAELHGPAVIGAALGRIGVVARFHGERYLPAIHGRARVEQVPTAAPVGGFRAALTGLEATEARRWYGRDRLRLTDITDTHPSLADRLKALGVDADTVDPHPPMAVTAADKLLGADQQRFAEELDARWRRQVAMPWQMQHEQLQSVEHRLADLDTQAAAGELPVKHQWERVRLLADLREDARAREEARALLAREPAHAMAHFFLGQSLVEAGDAEGVLHLKAAMASDPEARIPAASLLFEYHWGRGERALAEPYRLLIDRRSEAQEAATAERAALKRPILLAPPEYPQAEWTEVATALRAQPDVTEAYLARREVELLPDEPCHMLGIRLKRRWWQMSIDQADIARLHALMGSIPTPSGTFWVLLEAQNKWLRKEFRQVEGSDLLANPMPPAVAPRPAAARLEALRAHRSSFRHRRLLRWVAIGGVVFFLLGWLLLQLATQDPASQPAGPVTQRRLPVEAAAAEIVAAAGQPRLVVIYWTRNNRSVLTPLLQYGFAAEARGLALMPYAGDRSASSLQEYWLEAGFEDRPQAILERWPSGHLVAALDAAGITMRRSFRSPFVALLDAKGDQVATWEAPGSMEEVRQVTDSVLGVAD